ncbi:MAG TPA: type IV pilus biogenesis/stability protein PilW [Casimicrobiaceae bacterium]
MRPIALALSVTLAFILAACSSTETKPPPDAAAAQRAQAAQQRASLPQPQPTPPAVRARMHTDLAAGYYERGQMDIAIDELNLAVGLDANYAPAYNVYGLVYSVLGENAKAEQNFMRALELAPSDSDIHHNWGWYLCQHKREREALAQFDIAVRNPLYKSPEIALVNAGRCAITLGDMRLAESYFRRALVAQPGNALAGYGLALIAYKEARYTDARNWMKGVMQTTNPQPEVLYLGMCVERKLGDTQAELSYVSQMKNRYPDAAETKAIATEGCQ